MSAAQRPSNPQYQRISTIIREHLDPIVGASGRVDLAMNNAAEQIYDELVHDLTRALLIDRETVGRLMHESWTTTKRSQGFHGPRVNCLYCLGDHDDATPACKWYHADLIPWDELPEGQKEINRHAFDDVLRYMQAFAGLV